MEESLNVKMRVFGYLAGDLWEEYEKSLLGVDINMPCCILNVLKKEVPKGGRKNIKLKKPFYISHINNQCVENLCHALVGMGVLFDSCRNIEFRLIANSRYFYKSLHNWARKENMTVAEIAMDYKIFRDNGDIKIFSPKSCCKELLIIQPEERSYSLRVKNLRVIRVKKFSELLKNSP